MHVTNTFVVVADDCRASSGVVPTPTSGRSTVAVFEYELLSAHPYRYTLEDLIFEVHLARNQVSRDEREARGAEIRARLFERPHACISLDQELRLGRSLRRERPARDFRARFIGIYALVES
jgi:Family of unknown function (DUF6157)